ncbi:hypothetical protein [Allosphingosinicella deserti]|uniref:hypothetical protein n=1 Tax=Allosphingosinicella deserti TaxID=2116704 RepID=UPI001304FE1C|nr:hypothetical protein [Sphingomonas deserti]
MWTKLTWDAEVFREIQIAYPDEPEPLAYAAINVCIAAQSLRNWVENSLAIEARKRKEKFSADLFLADLYYHIPQQAMCEAIANTAKHARYNDERWPGGEVRLEWHEGNEDAPPGYMLRQAEAGETVGELAANRFQELCDHWWAYLSLRNLSAGTSRLPAWQQRKLHRIFSDRDGHWQPF